MIELANTAAQNLTDVQRKEAAMAIWNQEKGLAAMVIILSWICKVRHLQIPHKIYDSSTLNPSRSILPS